MAKKLSIQEAMNRKANLALGIVEYEIDLFLENNYKSDFNMLKYLKQLKYKRKIVEIMRDEYLHMLSELTSTEEDFVEAYNFMTDAQKKKFIAFVEKIRNACDEYITLNEKRWAAETESKRVQNRIKRSAKKRMAEIEKQFKK